MMKKVARKKKPIIIICLLLVTIIGFAFYFIYKSSNSIVKTDSIKINNIVGEDDIEYLRKNPKLIYQSYLNNQDKLYGDLPASFQSLSEKTRFAIYVAMATYDLAPYGNSIETDFLKLLNAPQLDCDNYAIAYMDFMNLYSDFPIKSLMIGFAWILQKN